MSKIISLDENAYQILKNAKEKLKERGIKADFSDAVRFIVQHKEG